MADMEKTGKNLEGRGFRVHRFATGAEAAEFLVQTLHGTSIGIGGSVTIDTLGVYDRLCESNEVFWHWKNHAPETRERAGKAETYLCSANGVSENGEIVNIDGFGNRVAGTIYGAGARVSRRRQKQDRPGSYRRDRPGAQHRRAAQCPAAEPPYAVRRGRAPLPRLPQPGKGLRRDDGVLHAAHIHQRVSCDSR